MLEKKVTKLWQGRYTSVRDYEIKSAIKKGGMVIFYNDKQMIINPDELKNLKPTSKVFQSKFRGAYRLVDILFKPNAIDHRQEILL